MADENTSAHSKKMSADLGNIGLLEIKRHTLKRNKESSDSVCSSTLSLSVRLRGN